MTPAISLLLKIKQIYQIYLFPSYLVFTTRRVTVCTTCTHLLITGKVTSTTTVLELECVVHTHNVYNVQQCYCVTVLCILPGTTYYLLHVVLATGVHTLECARVLRTTYNYVCAHHTLCFVCAHTCVPRTTCVCAHTCVYHTHLTYIHT